MSAIDSVKAKCQRILTEVLGSVRVDRDGDFVVTHNSAVVFVGVHEGFGEDGVLVTVTCPLITKVKVTNDLYKWVATEGQRYRVGATAVKESPDGSGAVYFRHNLIADDLDESELMGTIFALLFTCDDLDNELQRRFGGELFGSD